MIIALLHFSFRSLRSFIIHLYVTGNVFPRHSTIRSSTLPLHQKTIPGFLLAASSWSTPTLPTPPSIYVLSPSLPPTMHQTSPVNERDGLWLSLFLSCLHQPTSFYFCQNLCSLPLSAQPHWARIVLFGKVLFARHKWDNCSLYINYTISWDAKLSISFHLNYK